jgi:hypothetical protein
MGGEVASWIALPPVARTARLGVLLLASRRPLAFTATQAGGRGRRRRAGYDRV